MSSLSGAVPPLPICAVTAGTQDNLASTLRTQGLFCEALVHKYTLLGVISELKKNALYEVHLSLPARLKPRKSD